MDRPEWKLDEHQQRILSQTCQEYAIPEQLITELMTIELEHRTRGSMWGVLNALEGIFDREITREEAP